MAANDPKHIQTRNVLADQMHLEPDGDPRCMRSPLPKLLYWISFAVLAALGLYGIVIGFSLGWIALVLSGALLGGYAYWTDDGPYSSGASSDDVAYRAKAAGISIEEMRAIDAKIDHEHQITVALVEKFSLPSGRDEPLPPWIEFPGFSPYHIFWRMGAGESYLLDPFWPFMSALDKSERERYFARYDLGEEWPHRQDWYRGWVEKDD